MSRADADGFRRSYALAGVSDMERAEERAGELGLQEYSQECLQLAEEIQGMPQVRPQLVVARSERARIRTSTE